VERATYIHHGKNKDTRLSISRYGQIVRAFNEAGLINVPFNPDGANLVGSPRVALISLHFNSAPHAGAMFTSIIRGIGSGGSDVLAPNQAVSQGPNPAAAVSRNLVTSTLEYMLRSLKDKGALPEAKNKHVLYYWDAGIVRNGAHALEFDLHGRPGAVFTKSEKMKGEYEKPPKYVGPVTVASGLDPSYDGNDRIINIAIDKSAITIPNTTLIEVASYVECNNARALAQSLARRNVQECYNEQHPPAGCPPPPDTNDPLDVAAEDIAHGLVEYYESYVPGFKQKACDNLKNSDWKDNLPDWCGSTAGGGGNGTADIDNISPSSIEVTAWANAASASSGTVSLSFSNVGTADLEATVSTSMPIVSIGTPEVYPTGEIAMASANQQIVLSPGETAKVGISYKCSSVGEFSKPIVISSNDPDEPVIEVPMVVHCKEKPSIYIRGYDVLKNQFYESYGDNERYYVPEYTAMNFWMESDEAWGVPVGPNPSINILAGYSSTPITVNIETPSWLQVTPSSFELNIGDMIRFSQLDYSADCDGPGEKNGKFIITTTGSSSSSIEIPVRLMCIDLEVEFDPDTYNDPEDPVSTWCGLLYGSVAVIGADNLKELFVRVLHEYDDDDNRIPVGVEYAKPRMSYIFKKDDWSSIRWPHPLGTWSWDSPSEEIPFSSWTNSCVFDVGKYTVEDFTFGPFVSKEKIEVEIKNNQFPGIVYNISEIYEDGAYWPLSIDYRTDEEGEHLDFSLSLKKDEWDWSAHSFADGYKLHIDFWGSKNTVEYDRSMWAIYDSEKIKYCTLFVKLKPDSMKRADSSEFYFEDMPDNVYWGQVVEYVNEDPARGPSVTEVYAGAWCYQPWDSQNATGSGVNSQGQQVMLPPWERGEKPQWTPINELLKSRDGRFAIYTVEQPNENGN